MLIIRINDKLNLDNTNLQEQLMEAATNTK